jgi:chromosomal replication initiator protein
MVECFSSEFDTDERPARMPGPASPTKSLLLIPENRSAYRALERVLLTGKPAARGLVYLYGPSGVGKSRLIAHFLRELSRKPTKLRILSLTASEFAARIADASQADALSPLQEELSGLDLLVCEDLQSLQRRTESQRQLLLAIDALLETAKTVILSADSLPGGWKSFDRRLADRCRGGLSVAVEFPKAASRIKLIQTFGEAQHLLIPPESARRIAMDCPFSPRDLEAFVNRLAEQQRKRGSGLTADLIDAQIEQEYRRPGLSPEQIVKRTAAHFQVTLKELRSPSRRQDIVLARCAAMYLIRTLTETSHAQIAAAFGKSDHTAALRGIQKIERLLEKDSTLAGQIEELRKELCGS